MEDKTRPAGTKPSRDLDGTILTETPYSLRAWKTTRRLRSSVTALISAEESESENAEEEEEESTGNGQGRGRSRERPERRSST